MKLLNTIDINAECPMLTLEQIKRREPDFGSRWKMRNDMIKSVQVIRSEHGFLSLGVEYVGDLQGVGYGYRSEGNIGLMIQGLAKVVGKEYTTGDILHALANTPIRVISKFEIGAMVAETTYIGHFMEDKFVKFSDLIKIGIVEEKEDAK